MRKIRMGLVLQQMDDKWFVFWERDAQYFTALGDLRLLS